MLAPIFARSLRQGVAALRGNRHFGSHPPRLQRPAPARWSCAARGCSRGQVADRLVCNPRLVPPGTHLDIGPSSGPIHFRGDIGVGNNSRRSASLRSAFATPGTQVSLAGAVFNPHTPPRRRSVLMKALVACEFSGRITHALRARGVEAFSCDLEPTEGLWPEFHFQCDVRLVLSLGWDLLVAHPPCTYLATSAIGPGRDVNVLSQLRCDALDFVKLLWAAPVARIAIENPVSILSTVW